MRMHWLRAQEDGLSWPAFLAAVRALKPGQLWRHNQAGDLPGLGDEIDERALAQLVKANAGRRGFTFTHKPLRSARDRTAIRAANARGFTINLSADTLAEADRLADLRVGPVAVLLPSGARGKLRSPAGRVVVMCPAEAGLLTCAECRLCSKAHRKAIVGFPAHGSQARRVDDSLRRRLQVVR